MVTDLSSIPCLIHVCAACVHVLRLKALHCPSKRAAMLALRLGVGGVQVLVNGPGTCIPICAATVILRFVSFLLNAADLNICEIVSSYANESASFSLRPVIFVLQVRPLAALL